MGKGKKTRKQDDDWENDLEEISKETGIDLDQNGENVEDFSHTNKKEKKKRKEKQLILKAQRKTTMKNQHNRNLLRRSQDLVL